MSDQDIPQEIRAQLEAIFGEALLIGNGDDLEEMVQTMAFVATMRTISNAFVTIMDGAESLKMAIDALVMVSPETRERIKEKGGIDYPKVVRAMVFAYKSAIAIVDAAVPDGEEASEASKAMRNYLNETNRSTTDAAMKAGLL